MRYELTLEPDSTDVVLSFEWKEGFASLAYFCPKCGHIWAMAKMVGAKRYHAVTTPCQKHPWPESPNAELPGDLFLPFETDYNTAIEPFAIPFLNGLWANSHDNDSLTARWIDLHGQAWSTHCAWTFDSDFEISPTPKSQDPSRGRNGEWKNPFIENRAGHGPSGKVIRNLHGAGTRGSR